MSQKTYCYEEEILTKLAFKYRLWCFREKVPETYLKEGKVMKQKWHSLYLFGIIMSAITTLMGLAKIYLISPNDHSQALAFFAWQWPFSLTVFVILSLMWLAGYVAVRSRARLQMRMGWFLTCSFWTVVCLVTAIYALCTMDQRPKLNWAPVVVFITMTLLLAMGSSYCANAESVSKTEK